MSPDVGLPYALVVEDHPLVADSLVAYIQNAHPGLAVKAVESLQSALAVLDRQLIPCLIVTDLTLIDAKDAEAVTALRGAAPSCPLLVVTALDDVALRDTAAELGVAGYFLKRAGTESLRGAIRAILDGTATVSSTTKPNSKTENTVLTSKQCSVLDELAAGRSNREIAARLNISMDTVGSHMKDIFGRLGVKNRTEAVVRYLQLQRSHDPQSADSP